MSVRTIEHDGNDRVVKWKIFGTMPMRARLRPEEARAGLKLLNLRVVWFLVTFLFRWGEGVGDLTARARWRFAPI
ncbi:MAG TPA: hypothetical protein VKS60_01565 [Stellaceae bacterium]|nr:hypothetical protein [Stellaceae bacterium]